MFGVTGAERGTESEDLHEYFCQLQEKLFSQLGLHYRVLEMSPNELGSPAYRKYDIEAWMPGRKQFGEISSCSNCTDYQSRRLNIRYKDDAKKLKFVHTLNGTACAIPRMLIAIVESNQNEDGNVTLPPVLQKYMTSEWDSNPTRKDFRRFMKNRGHQEKVFLHYDPWRQ
jgi:seryl-tRNA synthetase